MVSNFHKLDPRQIINVIKVSTQRYGLFSKHLRRYSRLQTEHFPRVRARVALQNPHFEAPKQQKIPI